MVTIQVVDLGGIIGVLLTGAIKIAALGVIWYCGLAIRRVSKTEPERIVTEARPRKKGEGVDKIFPGNTHYAPLVLTNRTKPNQNN